MTDPVEGRLGALVCTGWIGEAPTGQDEAYLLLATPGRAGAPAAATMPLIAAALGLDATPGAVTFEVTTGTRVSLGADGWATLHTTGGERLSRPAGAEWMALASARRRVVLVVAYEPLPAGVATEDYVERLADSEGVVLGLVPLTDVD